MTITINLVDDSGLSSNGALWITGHGIPGSGGATNLMALGADGTFTQAATQITSAAWSNNVATITTAVAHNLSKGDNVFVAGVSPAGYNGLFQITGTTSTTFTYALSNPGANTGSGGTAYAGASITAAVDITAAQSMSFDSTSGTGLAQATTSSAHGLQTGQTIQISGVAVSGYNGVFSIAQVPSATTFQYSYAAASALGNASAGGDVQAVGLQPVALSGLPQNKQGVPQITLDGNIATYSAKLIVFAVPGSDTPASLPFNGNGVTPTDPTTPPFSPSTTPGNFVFDIVEFAYIAGGNSTFDVSAVDGLAIPMTLTASSVTSGPSSVGVQQGSTYDRAAIASAFTKFTAQDSLGANFAKLLYNGAATLAALDISTATWSNNAATFTTTTAHGLSATDWIVIAGVGEAGYNGNFQVQSIVSTTSFTVTNTDSSLTSSTGGTATPLVFAAPPSIDGQYYNIAAPKDWLSNQSASMAAGDSLAMFWDTAIDDFFASGNYLSIYLGKDPQNPTYSGSSDGTQYTLSNNVNKYSFAKPTGGSLANALYVWSQANAPSDDEGLLQDQIWQALCRGVAQAGVSTTSITNNESTTAWTQSAKWYQSGTYCPYSKFLHYGTLEGGTDFTGATSIFLEAAAYGFGEDENPIGDPSYQGPLVPSKLDGTVPDGTTLTLRIAPWTS